MCSRIRNPCIFPRTVRGATHAQSAAFEIGKPTTADRRCQPGSSRRKYGTVRKARPRRTESSSSRIGSGGGTSFIKRHVASSHDGGRKPTLEIAAALAAIDLTEAKYLRDH